MLKRKNSRNVDDDYIRVAREAEEAERKKKEAHDLLESRKTLFPAWTRERMIKEAIETPSILWLEPVISFDCNNTVDSQFDMPLTRNRLSSTPSLTSLKSLIRTLSLTGSSLTSIWRLLVLNTLLGAPSRL